MAQDKATPASLLMNLPLEVRHTIFEYAAERQYRPKKLLRYWFEKKEIKDIIAKDPTGSTPLVVQGNEYEQDSDTPEQQDDEDEDSEGDNDEELDEDEDDDNEDEDEEEDEEDVEGELDQGEDEEANDEETIDAEGEHDVGEAAQDEVDEGDETNIAEEDDNTALQQTQAPAPVVRAARKWRYIPNFMRITHSPPPVELLLASKQLNEEAKNWFYDVAILRINASGSFAHTSFFEEAFEQITEAAFSPMENIRKAEVTFVWDTTWLRAESTGCAAAIFPALLRQRSEFVHRILERAPDLREVTVHWHDSAQDDESANFMIDVLAPFHSLNANIKIEEHYIAVDAKPHKKSVAGKRRVEFENIVADGLDRLY